MKPRALDLFCGAGGASMGLHRAGFDVVGVDIKRQPRYPFAFVRADALRPPFDLGEFDLIWASPPCQAYTVAAHNERAAGKVYADLIVATRDMLAGAGRLTVIENVPGAPMKAHIVLDGTMFPSLKVIRRRHFETNFRTPLRLGFPSAGLLLKGWCCVVGGGTGSWMWARGARQTAQQCRDAMGIDWMTRIELSQAIPPAYAEFIGRAALAHLQARAA